MTLRTHPACERARLWGLFADALPRTERTRGPVYCLRFANIDRPPLSPPHTLPAMLTDWWCDRRARVREGV